MCSGVGLLAFSDDTSIRAITEKEHLATPTATSDTFLQAGVRFELIESSFGVQIAKISGSIVSCTDSRLSDKHIESICRLPKSASEDEMDWFWVY